MQGTFSMWKCLVKILLINDVSVFSPKVVGNLGKREGGTGTKEKQIYSQI